MPETEDVNNDLLPGGNGASERKIQGLLYEKWREFYSSPCALGEFEEE